MLVAVDVEVYNSLHACSLVDVIIQMDQHRRGLLLQWQVSSVLE